MSGTTLPQQLTTPLPRRLKTPLHTPPPVALPQLVTLQQMACRLRLVMMQLYKRHLVTTTLPLTAKLQLTLWQLIQALSVQHQPNVRCCQALFM
jgi:hypothetical protein